MVNNATLVLPAPVGAQTNMFSGVLNAASNTLLWITFRALMLPKGFLAQVDKLSILTKLEV